MENPWRIGGILKRGVRFLRGRRKLGHGNFVAVDLVGRAENKCSFRRRRRGRENFGLHVRRAPHSLSFTVPTSQGFCF